MNAKTADWLSIILQGLFGAFLGTLAGWLIVMHRVTGFLVRDPQSSVIMVAGCAIAGSGWFMSKGDALLVPVRTLPAIPMRHSAFSRLLFKTTIAIGIAIVAFGLCRYFLRAQSSESSDPGGIREDVRSQPHFD